MLGFRTRTGGLATGASAVALLALASATAGANPSHSALPTASPPPSASPGASSLGGEFGATQPIYNDDFSDETRWYVGSDNSGSYAYKDGAYLAEVTTDNRTSWSFVPLDPAKPVVHILGTVTPVSGRGAAGYLCMAGSGDAAKSLFATVSTAGDWVLGSTSGSNTSVLARGPLPLFSAFDQDGLPTTISLDCAMTQGDGHTRASLWIDGQRAGEVQTAEGIGPFDHVGVILGDEDAGFSASFDDLSVLGGDDEVEAIDSAAAGTGNGSTGSPSASPSANASAAPLSTTSPEPSASPEPTAAPSPEPSQALSRAQLALLEHVPAFMRTGCMAADPLPDTAGQVASVQCPGSSGISVWYYQFNSKQNVDAAFDAYTSAKATGKDCQKGPSTITFNVNGKPVGSLACYTLPDTQTVQFQWVNEPLKILAFAQQESGTFADVFSWWRTAGPVS
jgi:hypothetical protein